jgi:hypothetical protein
MRSIVWLPVACLLACNVSPNQTTADSGSGDTAPPATDAGNPDNTNNPPPPALFTLQVQIVGQGSVTFSPAGIDCASSCAAEFAAGTVVLLAATPAAGQDFLGWSGPCGGTGTCTVTLGTDTVAIANFAVQIPPPVVKAQHTLMVATAGTGTGSVSSAPQGITCGSSCAAPFDEGTVILLTASPAAGSQFAGWSGACAGTGPCTITLTADVQVTAAFAAASVPLSCVGISPASSVPIRQHVLGPLNTSQFECLDGLGDASGTLAFPMNFTTNERASLFDFVLDNGGFLTQSFLDVAAPRPVQQITGLSVWGDRGFFDPDAGHAWRVHLFDSSGHASFASVDLFGTNLSGAVDSNSGVLLAGDLATFDTEPLEHVAIMVRFAGLVPNLWKTPLASRGAVFGTGVDRFGRAIVITDGSLGFGPHSISAQIFDAAGQALSGEFLLSIGFSPGNHTWFETSALIGGGWLVRRMDQDLNGAIHAHAFATIPGNGTSVSAAPAWMTSRPDTKLVIVRGGTAYALLPYGAQKVTCTQTVELLAPDGTLCSTSTYPIAAGICDTRDLTMSEDGTVIQLLPDSMEPPPSTCTWRWWARTLH